MIDMIDIIHWIATITPALGVPGLLLILWIATSLCPLYRPDRPER
jgi:hypothetical protein